MHTTHESAAQKVERRSTRKPDIEIPLEDRAALKPREFAAYFGRSETWAYRKIYAGEVQVLRLGGRILIPREEVKRLTADTKTIA